MSNKNSTGVSVGSISLLVIFLVLCMSIFSVLSLTTAKAELRLAEMSARVITGYYDADLACMEKMERLQEMLNQGATSSDVVREAELLGGTATLADGAVRIEYSHHIIPGQDLQAVLEMANGKISILSWKAIDVGDWEPDETLNLWTGDLPF